MYRLIGLCGASASRKRSCATTDAEIASSTPPFKQIIRSRSSRLKMSYVCQPPPIVSVTKGIGMAACGGRAGVALWDGGYGGYDGRVVKERVICWRIVREARGRIVRCMRVDIVVLV